MSNIKISIGIPTYNQADYLAFTIESVLKQTIGPFEIVISDNHSTDRTAEILLKYKDYIKIVKPDHHLSMMENWNFLISQMSGEWISLISSDDLYKCNFIEQVSKEIRRNKKAVLIRGGTEYINQTGSIVGRSLLLSTKYRAKFPANFMSQLNGPKVSFASFCIKKSVFEKVAGFSTALSLNADWDLWLRISPYGEFISIKKCIAQYRASYRKKISQERIVLEVQDDYYIHNNTIPSIVNCHSELINSSKVSKSNMNRYVKDLVKSQKTMNLDQKKYLLDVFVKWAEILNDSMYIELFKNDSSIRFTGDIFSKYAKKIYDSVF